MRFTLGVDEAGRGPLAGPVAVGVVAVAAGFDVAREFPGVTDSKKLTEKNRERIFEMLEARVTLGDARFTVELGPAAEIDEQGIAVVIRALVARGIRSLENYRSQTSLKLPKSDFDNVADMHVLLDGSLSAPPEYPQETVIHGDMLIPVISLASIAAKVERDRVMVALAAAHPLYGFERHKGYGTKDHYEALKKHGLCAIHRRSFVHLAPEGV